MKKKLLLIVFSIFFMFVGIYNVSAEEVTDINDFTIDVDAQTGNAGSGINIYVNGVLEENIMYYLKFINKNDSKPDLPSNDNDVNDSSDNINDWKAILHYSDTNKNEVSIKDDWFLLNGYEYAYILKCDINTCQMSDEPIEVEKPKLPNLGERYHVFYFSEDESNPVPKISVFPYFPYFGSNGNHMINIKIGVINDKNLLRSVYKKDADALEKLLEYAKTNDGKIISNKDVDFNDIVVNDFNVTNGLYYFVYTTYDNNNGLYRDLSDIALVQAKNGYLVTDVDWDFDKEEPTSQIITTTQKPEKILKHRKLI